MFAYIVRRILTAIPVLLILIFISFALMYATPGGPFTQERALPPEVMANLNAKYGLDQPFLVQVWRYIKGIVFDFDFGPSYFYKDRSVNEVIADGFPVTLTYGFWSFLIAVAIGVGTGVIAAVRQNSFFDYVSVSSAIFFQSIPNFVMAPILVIIFTLWLQWLPGGGWGDPNGDTAFWKYLIMPVIALSTSYFASIARITRSSMLETLNSNFIRTARAKGLPESTVLWKHAFKPAMLPIISYLGPAFVGMITGSVVIDMYFGTGGMGKFFVSAAQNRDYPVIMGCTILVGALTILFNLIADILYAWIDPRIRY